MIRQPSQIMTGSRSAEMTPASVTALRLVALRLALGELCGDSVTGTVHGLEHRPEEEVSKISRDLIREHRISKDTLVTCIVRHLSKIRSQQQETVDEEQPSRKKARTASKICSPPATSLVLTPSSLSAHPAAKTAPGDMCHLVTLATCSLNQCMPIIPPFS